MREVLIHMLHELRKASLRSAHRNFYSGPAVGEDSGAGHLSLFPSDSLLGPLQTIPGGCLLPPVRNRASIERAASAVYDQGHTCSVSHNNAV